MNNHLQVARRHDGNYNLWRKLSVSYPTSMDQPKHLERASEWEVVAVAKSYKRACAIQDRAANTGVIEQAER